MKSATSWAGKWWLGNSQCSTLSASASSLASSSSASCARNRSLKLTGCGRARSSGSNAPGSLATAPETHRQRFLTPEETQRLITSISDDQNPTAAKAIMLLLLTGPRRNELTQAKWQY